jgi:chromosome partitioning protein
MKTVVLASTKGGVGKTTLATGLACEAASDGKKVSVIDLDPIQSTAWWFELRGDARGPTLITDVGDLAHALATLASAGFDYVVIDTPPGPLSLLVAAVAGADFVVIPCRASPVDVEASTLVVELIRRANKPYAFVMNAVPVRSELVAGAIEFLRARGDVLDIIIPADEHHPKAMIEGRTARETGDGGDDIRLLWREIATRLEKSQTEQ